MSTFFNPNQQNKAVKTADKGNARIEISKWKFRQNREKITAKIISTIKKS